MKITYFQNSSVVDSVTVLFPLSSYLWQQTVDGLLTSWQPQQELSQKHTVHFSSSGGKKNTRNLLFLN